MIGKRKYIRLYGFDYSRIGAYFLTICTHNRQRLFGDEPIKPNGWFMETDHLQYSDSDGITPPISVGATLCGRPKTIEMIEHWIHEIPKKFNCVDVDYYVIMPDHIHLILFLKDIRDDHIGSPLQKSNTEPLNPKLGQIIDWFKTMTTNEYIRLVKNGDAVPFDDHVWQRNYNDHIIRNREDLYETRKYIKTNPLK